MITTLDATLASIDDLLTWGPNWNTYEAEAPDPAAIARAKEWITDLYRCVQEWELSWLAHRVCADASDGSVILAWDDYDRRHELNITVGAQGPVDIFQVTRTGKQGESEYGESTRNHVSECKDLWQWLCEALAEKDTSFISSHTHSD